MANSGTRCATPIRHCQAPALQVHVLSDLQVHNASYLRLKNVSVGYTFDPAKRVKWLRDITLSVSGENPYPVEIQVSTLTELDIRAKPDAAALTWSSSARARYSASNRY